MKCCQRGYSRQGTDIKRGYACCRATARLSTRAADAYAEAAAVVAEALASIRTVLALCGAPAIVQNYAAVCPKPDIPTALQRRVAGARGTGQYLCCC